MHPAPTEEQRELQSSVRDFCVREVTPERLLALEQSETFDDLALRRAVAELGWLGLGLPAVAGGSGADLIDVACLIEECARGLLPRPIIAAMRGALALADVDGNEPRLADLASGRKSLALAFDERMVRDPEQYRAQIRVRGDSSTLSGEKAFVVGGADFDLHLVAARDVGADARSDGVGLAIVDRCSVGVGCERVRSFGGDPQAHVKYEEAAVLRHLTPATGGKTVFDRVWRRQVALALAEMVGGMDAVLETTVRYVKEREQFGQKIALFQAVRHQVADMGTIFTAARHLAWQAITRVAKQNEQGIELMAATAYVGQAFKRICWAGHHLHGGAGFVIEHSMRFHSERAQSLCIRYAPEAPALEAIATALLDT